MTIVRYAKPERMDLFLQCVAHRVSSARLVRLLLSESWVVVGLISRSLLNASGCDSEAVQHKRVWHCSV
jgi:hypothetical protein